MPTVKIGDDEFEILNVRNGNGNWMRRMFDDVSKQPVGKQLVVGGASGWCSGYMCGKIGKAAAAAVGGSLLLMQIAHHQGYITVNWGKLEKSMKKARKQIENGASKTNVSDMADEIQQFVKDNIFLAGGFAAGFLLGLAS